MPHTADAIPTGYHTVTPYPTVRGAAAALDFYARAFAATETLRLTGADGAIVHAQMRIGDPAVMLGEESAAREACAPPHFNGTR